MIAMNDLLRTLERIAPLGYAESWDNVGLLLGDTTASVSRVLTCLTVTDEVVQEAIDLEVQLIVSHHPLPFKPLNRITNATQTGRLLLKCARHGIAIYSPHTAWDNAAQGINWQLGQILELEAMEPMSRFSGDTEIVSTLGATSEDGTASEQTAVAVGQGRMGRVAPSTSIGQLQQRLRAELGDIRWRSTHADEHCVTKVGIICGSGGSYWSEASKRGCDALLTGEATYHQCLEAEANGVALMLVGHFASEFFAMKKLAAILAASHEGLVAECSSREHSAF